MWFLIRATFWFSMVLIMLPIFDDAAQTRLNEGQGVELTDALGAAAGAISYVGALCSEKPDVCVKGAETFTALGSRAREGARVAYTYLDTQFAEPDKAAIADKLLTGAIARPGVVSRIPIPIPRPKTD
jgi:hypothetical protein